MAGEGATDAMVARGVVHVSLAGSLALLWAVVLASLGAQAGKAV